MKTNYKSGTYIKCLNCGKDVYNFPCQKRKYCNMKCRNEYWNKINQFKVNFKDRAKKNGKILSCLECGNDFYQTKLSNKKFCGRDCYTKYKSAHILKNNKYPNLIARGKLRTNIIDWCRLHPGSDTNNIAWIMSISCEVCGWDRAKVDIHHIIQKRHGGSNKPENLIGLCPNCHRLVHQNIIVIGQDKKVIDQTEKLK